MCVVPPGSARLVALLCALAVGAGCRSETCALPEDCDEGQICDPAQGRCRAPGPDELDAGVSTADAGPTDGAAPDALAEADAGGDAGPLDGGALDGGADAGSADAAPPVDGGFDPVRLQFPPGGRVFTSTDAITVRGAITAAGVVSDVAVNGVPASSDDGFAHFSAEIPLREGLTEVVVTYAEDGQERAQRAGEVERQDILLQTPIEAVAQAGLLYVVDSAFDRLVRIDPATGAAVELSGPNVGSGTSMIDPQGLVLTSSGAEAFVLDRSRDAVLRVDLRTGARTIFSRGDTAGAGPAFRDPRQLALDEAGGRLFVVDSNLDTLFRVSLTDGARAVVSSDDVGAGQTFATPRAVAYDAPRGRVLVADTSRDVVFAVDPTTGDRAPIEGPGPNLSSPNGVARTVDGDGLWIADLGSDALVRMDLVTGARTLVANAGRGAGPWIETRAVAADASGVYVVDNNRDGIVRVDPDTGDRVSVYANVTYEGAHYGTPWGVAVHPVDPVAPILVTDNYFDRIIALDPRTGERRVLHSGATIAAPYGMAYDLAARRVLFVDTSLGALMAVDVNDGAATFVSDEVIAGGPIFSAPRDVALSADGRIFVVDDAIDSVFEVEPGGRRVLLGSDDTGTGAELEAPWAVAVVTSTSGLAVLVADAGTDVVMAVDPVTLERRPLPGLDADLTTPRGLALDPSGQVLYVSDQSRNLVYAYTLATGQRATVASNGVGRGVRLTAPVNLSYHPDGYLVVVDTDDALLAVDLETRERIYLSK